ncbi:MAG TPA: hypothetical protein PKM21_12790 [Anaerolineales bacterium]|nr:hypothetical protein [Anaerolineales bacterium]
MKLIDYSEKKTGKSPLQPLLDRIQEVLPLDQAQRTHQTMVGRFSRGLDNRFTLLHDVVLAPGEAPIPYILVGASGLVVMDVNSEQGMYRAKDETWAEMSRSTKSYQPSRRNFIKHTRALARKVNAYLEKQKRPNPEAVPVMIFLHPGVHIDSKNPAIRLVQIDGLERFIASQQASEEVLNATDVKLILDALEKAARPPEKTAKLEESEDFFGKDLGAPQKPAPTPKPKEPAKPRQPLITPPSELKLPKATDKLKFSKTQWIILSGLLIVSILIFIAMILVVVFA